MKLMSKRPNVSVVMPAYGPTFHLPAAIESVGRQTLPGVEFLIVDDNDPGTPFRQETERIVRQYQDAGQAIIYLQHERNKNGAAARNTGITRARGEYISFLDSDDVYHPRRLEVACEMMQAAAEQVVGCYTGVEFRKGGKAYASHRRVESGNFLVETLACTFLIGTGSNLFVRRSVVDELGGFDTAFLRHQDYEFLVRLFEKYDLIGSREVLVIKNNENLNLPKYSQSLAIKNQYLEKFRPIIDAIPQADRDYVMRSNYTWLGEHALREGLRNESRAMYAIAGRHGYIGMRGQVRRTAFWAQSWLR